VIVVKTTFLPSFNVKTLEDGRKFGFDVENILDVFV